MKIKQVCIIFCLLLGFNDATGRDRHKYGIRSDFVFDSDSKENGKEVSGIFNSNGEIRSSNLFGIRNEAGSSGTGDNIDDSSAISSYRGRASGSGNDGFGLHRSMFNGYLGSHAGKTGESNSGSLFGLRDVVGESVSNNRFQGRVSDTSSVKSNVRSESGLGFHRDKERPSVSSIGAYVVGHADDDKEVIDVFNSNGKIYGNNLVGFENCGRNVGKEFESSIIGDSTTKINSDRGLGVGFDGHITSGSSTGSIRTYNKSHGENDETGEKNLFEMVFRGGKSTGTRYEDSATSIVNNKSGSGLEFSHSKGNGYAENNSSSLIEINHKVDNLNNKPIGNHGNINGSGTDVVIFGDILNLTEYDGNETSRTVNKYKVNSVPVGDVNRNTTSVGIRNIISDNSLSGGSTTPLDKRTTDIVIYLSTLSSNESEKDADNSNEQVAILVPKLSKTYEKSTNEVVYGSVLRNKELENNKDLLSSLKVKENVSIPVNSQNLASDKQEYINSSKDGDNITKRNGIETNASSGSIETTDDELRSISSDNFEVSNENHIVNTNKYLSSRSTNNNVTKNNSITINFGSVDIKFPDFHYTSHNNGNISISVSNGEDLIRNTTASLNDSSSNIQNIHGGLEMSGSDYVDINFLNRSKDVSSSSNRMGVPESIGITMNNNPDNSAILSSTLDYNVNDNVGFSTQNHSSSRPKYVSNQNVGQVATDSISSAAKSDNSENRAIINSELGSNVSDKIKMASQNYTTIQKLVNSDKNIIENVNLAINNSYSNKETKERGMKFNEKYIVHVSSQNHTAFIHQFPDNEEGMTESATLFTSSRSSENKESILTKVDNFNVSTHKNHSSRHEYISIGNHEDSAPQSLGESFRNNELRNSEVTSIKSDNLKISSQPPTDSTEYQYNSNRSSTEGTTESISLFTSNTVESSENRGNRRDNIDNTEHDGYPNTDLNKEYTSENIDMVTRTIDDGVLAFNTFVDSKTECNLLASLDSSNLSFNKENHPNSKYDHVSNHNSKINVTESSKVFGTNEVNSSRSSFGNNSSGSRRLVPGKNENSISKGHNHTSIICKRIHIDNQDNSRYPHGSSEEIKSDWDDDSSAHSKYENHQGQVSASHVRSCNRSGDLRGDSNKHESNEKNVSFDRHKYRNHYHGVVKNNFNGYDNNRDQHDHGHGEESDWAGDSFAHSNYNNRDHRLSGSHVGSYHDINNPAVNNAVVSGGKRIIFDRSKYGHNNYGIGRSHDGINSYKDHTYDNRQGNIKYWHNNDFWDNFYRNYRHRAHNGFRGRHQTVDWDVDNDQSVTHGSHYGDDRYNYGGYRSIFDLFGVHF